MLYQLLRARPILSLSRIACTAICGSGGIGANKPHTRDLTVLFYARNDECLWSFSLLDPML